MASKNMQLRIKESESDVATLKDDHGYFNGLRRYVEESKPKLVVTDSTRIPS